MSIGAPGPRTPPALHSTLAPTSPSSTPTATRLEQLPDKLSVGSIGWSPDGMWIYGKSPDEREVVAIDAAGKQPPIVIPLQRHGSRRLQLAANRAVAAARRRDEGPARCRAFGFGEWERYCRAIATRRRSSGSMKWSWSSVADVDLDPVDLAGEAAGLGRVVGGHGGARLVADVGRLVGREDHRLGRPDPARARRRSRRSTA